MKLKSHDGNIYTLDYIEKHFHPKLTYWVFFPQGVKEVRSFGVIYSNVLRAKTFKEAVKIAKKYNGAYIERLIECDKGRWVVKTFFRDGREEHELWDDFEHLPEVEIHKS